MSEVRRGAVRFKGSPIDLLGVALKRGDHAPEFSLQANDLSEENLSNTKGKTRILLTLPSLDTAVCAVETRRFNQEAATLDNTEILAVSMDLPFAQKRWCGAENVQRIRCLSAHANSRFGQDYGVLIQGGSLSRILARAAFVIDPQNTVQYAEYVPEIAEEPNYQAILKAAGA